MMIQQWLGGKPQLGGESSCEALKFEQLRVPTERLMIEHIGL
jgi:hypothetical protein